MDSVKPHYIEYIWIKDTTTGECLACKAFQPTDPSPPTISASGIKTGSTIIALLFCNLHGLWQGEEVIV
jgi:desulfoferrodoxin (superoxide reductase-like protein)